MDIKLGSLVEDDKGFVWRVQLRIEDWGVGTSFQLVRTVEPYYASCLEDGTRLRSTRWPNIGTRIVRVADE